MNNLDFNRCDQSGHFTATGSTCTYWIYELADSVDLVGATGDRAGAHEIDLGNYATVTVAIKAANVFEE